MYITRNCYSFWNMIQREKALICLYESWHIQLLQFFKVCITRMLEKVTDIDVSTGKNRFS